MNLDDINADHMKSVHDVTFAPGSKPLNAHIKDMAAGTNFFVGEGDKNTAKNSFPVVFGKGSDHDIDIDWHKGHIGIHAPDGKGGRINIDKKTPMIWVSNANGIKNLHVTADPKLQMLLI